MFSECSYTCRLNSNIYVYRGCIVCMHACMHTYNPHIKWIKIKYCIYRYTHTENSQRTSSFYMWNQKAFILVVIKYRRKTEFFFIERYCTRIESALFLLVFMYIPISRYHIFVFDKHLFHKISILFECLNLGTIITNRCIQYR